MIINVLFSIVGPDIPRDEFSFLSRIMEPVILNDRGGRLFIDALIVAESLTASMYGLDIFGRDPQIIGAWNFDGTMVEGHTLNIEAWRQVAEEESAVEFINTHGWAGWAEKQI